MIDSSASFISLLDFVRRPLIAALAASCFLHFMLLRFDPPLLGENRLLAFLVTLPTANTLQTPPLARDVTNTDPLRTDKDYAEKVSHPATESSSFRRLIYPRNELDVQPKVVGEISLEPPEGYSDSVAGTVTLSLLVAESGRVQWVGIGQTDLDPMVIEQVVAGFKNAHFLPGQKNGKAVSTIVHVEVEISPR